MMKPEDEDPDDGDGEEGDANHDQNNEDIAADKSNEPAEDEQTGDTDSSDDDSFGFMDILSDAFRNAWDFGDDEMVSVVRKWMGSEARKTLMKQGRSYDAISAEVKWQFHQRIRRPYRQGFELLEMRLESQAALGRRYGMNRATVKRWLDGNSEPSFDAFCVVSVADDCRYPRGHRIALDAYAAVLQRAQSLTGKRNVIPVTVEEVICLYLQTQQKQWWMAWFLDDEQLHDESAQRVEDVLKSQFGSQERWERTKQIAVFKKLYLEWSIIQEAIPYEWF
jgi:hypothetical protein